MKKILACALTFAIASAYAIPTKAAGTYKELYVSPAGSDTNPGTKASPFKTIQAAKNAVDTLNDSMTGDIVVNITEGTYYLDEMLEFGSEDSGKNGYKVIYRGKGNSKPIISGGCQITGFTKTEHEGIYSASLDTDAVFQLSVNGKRRYPAKSASYVKGVLDASGQTYDYNDPTTENTYDGFYVSKRDFKNYENPTDVILAWNRGFVASYIPVKRIMEDAESKDRLIVIPNSPSWETYMQDVRFPENPDWPNATYPKPEREFSVINAFELLDEPGEFYYNKQEKKLYYMPYEDEDMATADVTVPMLETLISLDGNDVSDKVKNLRFENLSFSDTKWDFSLGFVQSQSYNIDANGSGPEVPRAILIERADNIGFSNNIFSNTGGTAIDMYNAVTNSYVTGNAFYDIGGVAISSGAPNHGDLSLGSYQNGYSDDGDTENGEISNDGISDPVPSAHKNDPVELAALHTTKVTTTSFKNHKALVYPGYAHPDDRDKGYWGGMTKIHYTWANKSDYDTSSFWRDDGESGNKPYVMFELLKPYTISAVSIAMPGGITSSERADFEILVSNDKSFKNYTTLATVQSTNEGVNTYPFSDSEKYKFVMVRKKSVSPLSMGRVWIESNDRKPYVKNERCKKLTISNNLIERVGVSSNHSLGISVTHGEGHKILHNEVRHAGYTGISIGYQWHTMRPTCYNMEVAYNHIYDSCKLTNDGGGIYMLGPQKGSTYHHNHIENTNQSIHALYTDNGSRYQTLADNYIEGGMVYTLSPYVAPYENGEVPLNSIRDVVYRNTYALNINSNDAGRGLNSWEAPKREILGQPSKAAYDAYENAGLTAQYSHLREYVPENYMNYYDSYDNNKATMNDEWKIRYTQRAMKNLLSDLQYTRDNAKFGTGLGMYPIAYKYKLDWMIGYVSAKLNTDDAMYYTVAREFCEELKNSINRESTSKTLTMCNELIAQAKENTYSAENTGKSGTYTEEAIANAEAGIAAVAAMPKNSAEDNYAVLLKLEEVYNTLKDSRIDAEIENVYVPGAEEIKIDPMSRTVVVYMPEGESLKVKNMGITVNKTAMLWSIVTDEKDLGKGITVPVRNKVSGKFKVWEIKAEHVPCLDKETLNAENWVGSKSSDRLKYTADGAILSASGYGYVANAYGKSGKTSFSFNPVTQNEEKSFSILLGVKTYNDFDYSGKRAVSECMEIEFTNSSAAVYKRENGERTLLQSANTSGILWNAKNTLSYEISGGKAEVKLNGKEIYNGLAEGNLGKLAGFYNPYINVKVY